MVKIYTVSKKKSEDIQTMQRQVSCAAIRFIAELKAKNICPPEIEVTITEQYLDSYSKEKVAIILSTVKNPAS